MTWLACLIVVLGIGMAFGCCCDGVCLDCPQDDIEGLTLAITIDGVSGTVSPFLCSGGATPACADVHNSVWMVPYDRVSGNGCVWESIGVANACANIDIIITIAAGADATGFEFISVVHGTAGYALSLGDSGIGQQTCDIDLDVTYNFGGWPGCDYSLVTCNVATV